ncbi:hypothetical protein DFH08DRAFT_1049915 [Mycena albidolilacea]|uniref:DUF6534 domain-containing protein n=1 Tax=Mycena albidolilacea TaxID=1033008 RepID=A0AAD6Z676_9AGAR|nr:hypothetical protein DFH08DRAFT_1049915 [Mycena albidolilacea]
MTLPALDTNTGCLLIATWASSLLYMSEVYQGLYYFRHFEKDDWKLKTLVTVALLFDTVSTVGDYICVYLYTITHAGDLEYLSNGHWPIPLYALTTGVLGALVQGFLVIRYWRFTQNSLISLVLSLGIIIAFCSVVASSCMFALYPSLEDRLKLKIPAALWLVTEVAVDVGITSALLWEFRKARGILTETKGILDRLTTVTVRSGAVAAMLVGAALISYYVVPESNLSGGFLFPLGRVYVITLLANLNIRKSGRTLSTTVTFPVGILTIHAVFMSTAPFRPLFKSAYKIPDNLTPLEHSNMQGAVAYVPHEIEMANSYVSKKQQTLFTA